MKQDGTLVQSENYNEKYFILFVMRLICEKIFCKSMEMFESNHLKTDEIDIPKVTSTQIYKSSVQCDSTIEVAKKYHESLMQVH